MDMPQPLVRTLATNLKAYLTDGDRLALLLPGDNNSVGTMLAGVLTDTPPRRRRLDLLRRNTADPAVLDEAARLGYPLALISCVPDGWEELPPSQAVLLRYGPERHGVRSRNGLIRRIRPNGGGKLSLRGDRSAVGHDA